MRRGHGILDYKRLDGSVDIECRGGDRSNAFGTLSIIVVEFDAVRRLYCAPFLVLR